MALLNRLLLRKPRGGARRGAVVTRLRAVVTLLTIITVMAVSTNYGLYYQLSYILFLVLVLSYLWTWANGRRVTVSVTREARAAKVGGWLEEQLSIMNRSRFLPVGWVELSEESDMPDHGGQIVISLPGASYEGWTLRTLCKQRGTFILGPVSIVSGDPLGLFKRRRAFGGQHPFTVYPATVELPNLAVPASDLAGDSSSRLYTHVVTPDASGVREYAPGDSFNRVHWKTTARTGRLMVKEFEQEESTRLWLVLDMQEGGHAGEGEESTEEYGVTVAASIARKYLQAGLGVGLISSGDREMLLSPRPGMSQELLIMEALAAIRAKGTTPLGDLLGAHEHAFNRFCTVVVITPSADEAWLGSLRRLMQKRVHLSAVLVDSRTFGGDGNLLPLVGSLAAARVPTCLVKKGDDLSAVLDFGHAGQAI